MVDWDLGPTFIAGYICGDTCIKSLARCQCGADPLVYFNGDKTGQKYCCVTKNSTCNNEELPFKVACNEGQIMTLDQKCDGKCPETNDNWIAISTAFCDIKEECLESGHPHFSKICQDASLTSIEEFSTSYCSSGIACSKSKSKYHFNQCNDGHKPFLRQVSKMKTLETIEILKCIVL